MTTVEPPVFAARAPHSLRDFRLYLAARGFANTAYRMMMVAVGWQIYDLTNDALALGYVGLALFLPTAVCLLPAGDVADRYDRRLILTLGYGVLAVGTGLLLALTLTAVRDEMPYYAALALIGTAQAFTRPADTSFIPFLAPRERLAKAVAWAASVHQTATIVGPAIGGALYVFGPASVYMTTMALYFMSVALYALLRTGARKPGDAAPAGGAWERIREGIAYVRHKPIILGAITLDLFAVLLGGATALLPIYARDILDVGPEGLGALRSSQALGAVVMGLALAFIPLGRKAGRSMFAAVAAFGLCTIVFGLSTSFPLSLAALFALGAVNMISFSFRHTIIQMATPDDMRGRVSAVHALCTGASNELGDFESGVTAAWWGAVPAVVVGGVGTIAVVGVWMWAFPQLRRVDRMTDIKAHSG